MNGILNQMRDWGGVNPQSTSMVRNFDQPRGFTQTRFDPMAQDLGAYKFAAPAGSQDWWRQRRQRENDFGGQGDAYGGDRIADLAQDLTTRSNDAAMRQRYFDSIKDTPEYQALAAQGFDFSSGKALSGSRVNELWDANPELASGLMNELSATGVRYGNPADGSVDNSEKVAKHLMRYGVTSLSDLRQQGDAVINTRTGMVIPMRAFGGSSSGEGFTQFDLTADANGNVIPVPRWENSSDKGAVMGALSVLGMVPGIMGPLMQGINGLIPSGVSNTLGTFGTKALGGAIMGGAGSALTGGNILRGALAGGIGGGIGSLSPQVAQYLNISPELARGLTTAASTGIGTALRGGGNPLETAILGGLGAYTSGLAGSYGQEQGWNPSATRAIMGGLNSLFKSKGDPYATFRGAIGSV